MGAASALNAQPQNVSFKHVTIDDGLSQNAVFAILQDHRGFMWFGTKDGLNRYDGYSFTIYQHDPFDSTSLSSSYITALFEDSRGDLWIGTLDGGVNRFLREADAFERFNTAPAQPDNVTPNSITAITEDADGNIWIGTAGDGLLRLAKHDADADTKTPAGNGPKTKFFNRVEGVTKHASSNICTGILWLYSRQRLIWLAEKGGGERIEASPADRVARIRSLVGASELRSDVAALLTEISGFEVWQIGADGLIAESLGHFDSTAYQRQLEHGVASAQ